MKLYSILFTITGLLFFGGCKRPHHAIRTSYKADSSQPVPDNTDPLVYKKKNIKDMNLAEARVARAYFESRDEFELIEKVLERILKLSHNYQEQAECIYELANIFLSRGNFEKAQELYDRVITQYPGAPFHATARYRLILAHFWNCGSHERDQQSTEKAIALSQAFLEEFPADSNSIAVRDILIQCYCSLLQADLDRVTFYLSRYRIYDDKYALHAARKRILFVAENVIVPLEQLGYAFDTLADDVATLAEYTVYVADHDDAAELSSEQKHEMAQKVLTLLESMVGTIYEIFERHTNQGDKSARDKF